MSSIKLKHSGGNSMSIAAPSSNPAANRTITLNDNYAGDGSFVTANSSGNVGIGESSPATILHVKANSGDMLRLDRDNAGAVGNQVAFRHKDGSGNFAETGSVNCVSTSNADAGDLRFNTKASGGSNTERMRLDSNGNLLIGNTSHNNGAFGGSATGINVAGIQPQILLHETDTDKDAYFGMSGSQAWFYTADSINLKFGTADTERMRLESGGNLVWTGASTQYVQMTHSGDVMTVQTKGTGGQNYGMIVFRDGGGTYCGQITSHGTNHTTSYVTNSDYRLKQNEASISDGITRLKQLKPYRFEWKSSGNKVDGFFAHEAQAVVPESVIGTKDEVDSDNNPVYQGIDQSKLVPLLTAALQEAIVKIETLETEKTQMQTDLTALTARVAALEAG